jgi:hypothetical protein
MTTDATRRHFLAGASALLVATVLGTEAVAGPGPGRTAARTKLHPPQSIYRLSCRGRRGSTAAKLHNANLRFISREVAKRHRAHPGDTSRIVALTVSHAEYQRLFVRRRLRGGIRRRVVVPVADLRHLKAPA